MSRPLDVVLFTDCLITSLIKFSIIKNYRYFGEKLKKNQTNTFYIYENGRKKNNLNKSPLKLNITIICIILLT